MCMETKSHFYYLIGVIEMRKCLFSLLFFVVTVYFALSPSFASAATNDSGEGKFISPESVGNGVAVLTIFASSDASGSSFSTDGHAWITVSNTSSSNITVGKFAGVAPGKLVSLGTWGNKSEHTGLWYNLEALFVSQGAYNNRVSLSIDLNASQLSSINSVIANSDTWSLTNNCASFATKVWNTVAAVKLSGSTPTSLRDDIKKKFGYVTNLSFSSSYAVYYANGTGAPIRSKVY